MKILEEFKQFALKGNVIDMAVGIIIGAAFSTIVKSLVDDIVMPPIGYILGSIDFSNAFFVLREGTSAGPYATVAAAKEAGAVVMGYGIFFNSLISFLVVSWAIFFLVRGMNRLRKKEEAQPAAPVAPTEEVILLREIRDALQRREVNK